MTNFRDRPTPEVVLLILTTVVAALMVTAPIGILLVILIRPDVNVGGVVSSLFDVMKVIIGAVVGYAAGYVSTVTSQPRRAALPPGPELDPDA